MGKKVSDFDPAAPLDGTELVGIIQGGVKKVTTQDIANLGSGGGGGGSFTLEVAATYASISASTATRLVLVSADETNNGDKILYLYDGTALQLLIIL